jgi:hypothetical protein
MPLHLVSRSAVATFQAALILVALGIDSAIVSGQDTTGVPRVRSESPWLRVAIAEGNEKSPTFRRVVEAINSTNGIVYVQEGDCRRRVRACLHLSMETAGGNRFLRIFVDRAKLQGCELIALIGHELQHTLEVLGNPHIRTWRQMYAMFDLRGRTIYDTFESDAAMTVEMQVEKEICGSRE